MGEAVREEELRRRFGGQARPGLGGWFWSRPPTERLDLILAMPPKHGAVLLDRVCEVMGIRVAAHGSELEEDLRFATDLVASVLVAFDGSFRKVWSCEWHPYLLGDESVYKLTQVVAPRCSPTGMEYAMAILALCGLAYRFEAALRYRCRPGTQQVRATSWARAGLGGSARSAELGHAVTSVIVDDRYGELVRILSDRQWPRGIDSAEICALNAGLAVKVVS